MIVPLPDLWHFGIEAAQVIVQQIVFVTATKFGLSFSNFTDFRRDQISPDLTVLRIYARRLSDNKSGLEAILLLSGKF